ncbi:MAG: hypothetical protein M3Z92_02020 [Bacteroidota bacterium]|nr:hypothetical protein [Bacteroidota bacterium]MDQ6889053.1 hypothetical protein [Bacteroidota bacterium]
MCPPNSDTTRTAIKGALCVCHTDDGGKTWQNLYKGLPQEDCFDIMYRHALSTSGDALAFGTTTGNLFFSPGRGESWQRLITTFRWCILLNLHRKVLAKKAS